VHAALAAHITPHVMAGHLAGPLSGMKAAAALNGEVTAQAAMIAYLDNFHLMMILTIAAAFTLFFVRKPQGAKAPEHVVLE
jgi:MFS transporter, DHA2 family, multidrug resistance protein